MAKPNFGLINKAESIIINPSITKLTDEQKEILQRHRRHLQNQIQYYRGLLEANYKKAAECSKE